jgi:hypothetical protein
MKLEDLTYSASSVAADEADRDSVEDAPMSSEGEQE